MLNLDESLEISEILSLSLSSSSSSSSSSLVSKSSSDYSSKILESYIISLLRVTKSLTF